MFVVVNFDALAQASDIRIERRQVVFLCWEQDSNPSGSQTSNRQQTECPLTNQLSYRGSSYQTWTPQPFPMISEHSAHLTPQPFGIRTWLWWYTCLSLLISMLLHRQPIFESKGDELSSSAESRIRTHQGLRHQIASRMPTDKPAELSRIKLWNLNSTARPYDQRAFSPLDPTAVWHSHLALVIYMFVVVNFDALAQTSDIQIERRQVVFLCWEQDSNPSGSQTSNRQQTECPLTNPLSYQWSSYKTWTRQPVPMISQHSAHLTPQPFGIRTWLWRYTCLLLLISMLWHKQAIFKSKGDKLSSSAESRIRTHQGLRHQIASRLNAHWQTHWAIKDQAIKLELDSLSLWSASIQPTWPHSRLAFAPGSGDIHVCCC